MFTKPLSKVNAFYVYLLLLNGRQRSNQDLQSTSTNSLGLPEAIAPVKGDPGPTFTAHLPSDSVIPELRIHISEKLADRENGRLDTK